MLKFIKDAVAVRKDVEGEKGFTLVELIVVVAILAILAAIAIPAYGAVQKNARHAALDTAAANAATSVAAILAQDGTVDVTTLGSGDIKISTSADKPSEGADDSSWTKGNSVATPSSKNTDTSDVFVIATNSSKDSGAAWAGTSTVGTGHTW